MTELDHRPPPPRPGALRQDTGRTPSRLAGALRHAAPALLGYAAARALGVVLLVLWSAPAGKSAHQLLSGRWDSLWYVRVAQYGYDWELRLPDGTVHSDLAFFPLLPWLERLGAGLSPLSYADAGLLTSWVASLFAAWGIFAVADRLYGRRAGVFAALLWGVLPVAVVQSMAYSESLFTALAAWSLYALLTRRWITAGALSALAGLTRPVGMAAAAAVWVAVWSAPREWRWSPRKALGVLLAPLGTAGYVLWVGRRTGGGLSGYLDVQAQWGNGFDCGMAFLRFAVGLLAGFPSVLAGLSLIAGVTLLLWLYVRGVREEQPLPLLVYSGVVMALALGTQSYFGSKPRLLLPAFPLLLPLALALARMQPRRSRLVLGCVAVGSAVYGALWLNGSGPP